MVVAAAAFVCVGGGARGGEGGGSACLFDCREPFCRLGVASQATNMFCSYYAQSGWLLCFQRYVDAAAVKAAEDKEQHAISGAHTPSHNNHIAQATPREASTPTPTPITLHKCGQCLRSYRHKGSYLAHLTQFQCDPHQLRTEALKARPMPSLLACSPYRAPVDVKKGHPASFLSLLSFSISTPSPSLPLSVAHTHPPTHTLTLTPLPPPTHLPFTPPCMHLPNVV